MEDQIRAEVEHLLGELQDPVLVTDAEGRIQYANPAFEALSGWAAQALKGRSARFLWGPEIPPAVRREVVRALHEVRGVAVEVPRRRRDGRPFWDHCSLSPWRDDQGRLRGWISVHRDVSAVHAALAQHQQDQAQLKILARFYQALAETRRLLAARALEEAPEGVLVRWCQRLAEWGEARLVFLARVPPGPFHLEIIAAAGPALGYLQELAIHEDPLLPEGQGPGGRALRSLGTVAMASQDSAFAPWRAKAEAHGIGYSLAAATRLGDGTRLLLGLYRPPGPPHPPELEGLMGEMVEEAAAFLVRRAQARELARYERYRTAYQEIQTQLLEAEEPEEILRLLTETLARSTDAAFADVLVPRPHRGVLERICVAGPLAWAIAGFPPVALEPASETDPIPLPLRVWRSRAPVVIPNPQKDPTLPRRWQEPPLREIGVVAGWPIPRPHQGPPAAVVSIAARDADAFTPALQALIAEMVRSAALALDKAAHRRQLDRLQRYQHAALKAQYRFLQLPDAAALYQHVVSLLVQETDCLGAYVATPAGDQLKVAAFSTRDPRLAQRLEEFAPILKEDAGPLGHVAPSLAFRRRAPYGPISPVPTPEWTSGAPLEVLVEAVAAWPVQLAQDQEPVAVLTILSDDRDYFTPALLQLMAQLVESLRLALVQLKARQEMAHWAERDPLTGLPNRRALDLYLEAALTEAAANDRRLAVCLVDLDDFKPVNDRWGHETGDAVLKAVADRLRQAVSAEDFVARLGGDEFVLLCRADHAVDLPRTLNAVAEAVLGPYPELPGLRLNVSVGVAVFPDHGRRAQDLYRHADQALYRVKAHKRDRRRFWAVYSPGPESA